MYVKLTIPIFVVKRPFYPEDNPGCGCLVSLIPGIKDILDLTRGWSNYESMVNAVRTINNSRKRGKAYWPFHSRLLTCESCKFLYRFTTGESHILIKADFIAAKDT